MAMKITFLYLNLAKIHNFILKCTGGVHQFGNIPKKTISVSASLTIQNEIQSDIGNYIKITMTLNLKF